MIKKSAILASDQPFGSYFDACMIWGSLSGRMFYAGIRYKIHWEFLERRLFEETTIRRMFDFGSVLVVFAMDVKISPRFGFFS